MAQQAQIIFCIPSLAVVTITIAKSITVTIISTVAKSVAVPAAVTIITIVGIGLSISCGFSFSLSLAKMCDSSERVSRQAGGVMVASESRVDVVVVAQNETVGMVGGVGTPLAVVEAVTKAEALGRPMSVGGGVASVVSKPVTEAMTIVAVVGISISTPLSTGPIESA